jgi:hypothetical protein
MRRLALLALLGLSALALGALTGETGGGLPQNGVELLQLALLGIALLLVGARLRVLALRRRRGPLPERGRGHRTASAYRTAPARPTAPTAPARRTAPAPPPRAYRDEWSFPDPSEPAPTGLLPSTATARRQARRLAMSRDPQ